MSPKNSTLTILNILICLMLFIIIEVSAKKEFELTFVNFTCTTPKLEDKSKSWISALHCGLNTNTKRNTLNFEITYAKDVSHFDINIAVFLPRRPKDFVLLNITKLNGCDLMSNKKQVPLMNLGRQIMDHYSNLPKQCPMRANVPYYIRGFRLDIDIFPAFTFENDLYVKFTYFIGKQVLFSGLIKSRVGLKGGAKG